MSVTATLRTRMVRLAPLISRASFGTWTIQNRPSGRMPGLKSCSAVPELGSNRFISRRTSRVHAPHVRRRIRLVDAIVGIGNIGPAVVVCGSAAGVAQRRQTTKVGDAVELGVQPVVSRAHAGQKLANRERRKVGWSEHIAARDRNGSDVPPG